MSCKSSYEFTKDVPSKVKHEKHHSIIQYLTTTQMVFKLDLISSHVAMKIEKCTWIDIQKCALDFISKQFLESHIKEI